MLLDSYERNTVIFRRKLRVDYPRENVSLIYDLDMHMLYIIDRTQKRYFLARAGDENLAQRLLLPWARLQDGVLVRPAVARPMAEPTGALQNISGFSCTEYRLNYPSKLDVDVRIWSARIVRPYDVDKRYRKIWISALGMRTPVDVVVLLKELLNDINGIPIKTVTTLTKDGAQLTTTVTVTKLRQRNIADDDYFKIPDNFEFADQQSEDRPWFAN